MNSIYLGLKFVFSYFSIIPVKFKKEDDLSQKEVLNYTMFFLPLVGFVLGTITVVLYNFLDALPILGAIIASCVYFVLYGFIHTEAVLDVVDAVYARHSGKDAYKIIKEPTVGAIGVLYSVVFVILKVAAFSFLLINQLYLELIAITIISRMSIQFMTYFSTFKSSFVNLLSNSFRGKSFLISVVVFSVLILFLTKLNFLLFILLGFLLASFIGSLIKKALGFLNGDALGVILESLEIILSILVLFIWL